MMSARRNTFRVSNRGAIDARRRRCHPARWIALFMLSIVPAIAASQDVEQARMLDDFEQPGRWRVVTSDQVTGRLRQVAGPQGRAICLDYDFNGVSGYAGMQRELSMAYPEDYEFTYRLRGDSPPNDLQFKLIDESGDNVWWVNRTRVAFPDAWTGVVHRKRHISRAWGPSPDATLRRSRKLEFTVYNSSGGRGSVCFDSLTFRARDAQPGEPPRPRASALPFAANESASQATDGRRETAWQAALAPAPMLQLDLGRLREFGGLTLHWTAGEAATAYRISVSDDRREWRTLREVTNSNGGADPIALPETEARHIRLQLLEGEGVRYGLREIEVQPLAFGATPNDFIKAVAADSPRGTYPRGFHGEQPYWTIVGVDGGREQGLIGEDGAVELSRGGFSIEPFVFSEGKLVTWAEVQATQSLQDGYLPIPSVHWQHPAFSLDVTAFAHGRPEASRLAARYVLRNATDIARDYVLVLAARPFQVNPPSQFLNTTGGVSEIRHLVVDASGFAVDGKRIRVAQRPSDAFATAFDAGEAGERLRSLDPGACERCATDEALHAETRDSTGMASAALLFKVRLEPGESREFSWQALLTGDLGPGDMLRPVAKLQSEAATMWHRKLDVVELHVPEAGRHLVNTLRTALAHMLISRTGPRLQPGTRSYARAWIRDGAMIGEGLLRLGRADVAEEFLRWYAPFQFDNGKVPCCVDDRGSDPVPENDSHGEFVYMVAEVFRHTRDRGLLESMWPHVAGAVEYMDRLRLSERTEDNRARNAAFFGMMPASISHEGYSAKPMHSYWDNFWTLRGYKDAVAIARWLGREEEARAFAASRDQFRADLHASLASAVKQHGIDYLPGAAELGDFDATSTTIALAPGGEQERLPQNLLRNTFERYWREFVERRDGRRDWTAYTPYELRTVGSFVRLGWRERAHEALDFFFDGQQPRAWNQWAEVVSRMPRTPFFVGDLPHAWVASDYVRSALDLFAYERESDQALVIAAGVPEEWLEGKGVRVAGLGTPHGPLAFSLRRLGRQLHLDIPSGLKVPAGGIVLSLPDAWRAGNATLDGRKVEIRGGELRIVDLPAKAVIELP